jgi:hypothetical protein
MTGSPKGVTRPNVSAPELMKQFGELISRCAAIAIAL